MIKVVEFCFEKQIIFSTTCSRLLLDIHWRLPELPLWANSVLVCQFLICVLDILKETQNYIPWKKKVPMLSFIWRLFPVTPLRGCRFSVSPHGTITRPRQKPTAVKPSNAAKHKATQDEIEAGRTLWRAECFVKRDCLLPVNESAPSPELFSVLDCAFSPDRLDLSMGPFL